MNLTPAPLKMIREGRKTIELRLYDEKRKQIKIGDIITFVNTENKDDELTARVKDLYLFNNFEELYDNLSLLECGYTEDNIASASPSDMEQYYSKDKQKLYGVVGIKLALDVTEIKKGQSIMAEQFLTLMADLDDDSQKLMSGWYKELQDAGFKGVQTPGLPFHISLATFSLDEEKAVVEEMQRLGSIFSPIPVHISHIGMFAEGRVLFGGPDMNPLGLLQLHDAITIKSSDNRPWTPHVTILIDEPQIVNDSLRTLVKSFHPFMARITRLHLCAFWPTREIASVQLQSKVGKV